MPPRSEMPRRPAGERRSEPHLGDREAADFDVRHPGLPPRSALRLRRALHVDRAASSVSDRDAPLEERERRPGERDAVGRQPNALLVGELELASVRRAGNEPPRPDELHHAAREPGGEALDQCRGPPRCCRPHQARDAPAR